MGSNYVSLKLGYATDIYPGKKRSGKLGLNLLGKVYFTDPGDLVTWGHMAGEHVEFKEYDIVTLSVSAPIPIKGWTGKYLPKIQLGADWMLGTRFLKTDSLDLTAIFDFNSLEVGGYSFRFPLILRAHFGPMERLARYSESITSLGIGLAFTY